MMAMKCRSRIHVLRAEHDRMTQDELAHKIGCSRSTISRAENDASELSLKVAAAIASVFDTTIDELFLFEEVKKKPGREKKRNGKV